MSIDQEKLQKYANAYIIYEIAANGVDPRETLEGTVMRIKGYEGYKYSEYDKGRKLLSSSESYTDAILEALPGRNLVDRFQKDKVIEILEEKGSDDFESALELLYDDDDDELAFTGIVDVIGGLFDVLGFIFFLKDDTRYTPIRSRSFDERFKLLGVDSHLEGNCSWEKYSECIAWIDEIREYLKQSINVEITLLDAQSFLWVLPGIHEYVESNAQIVEHKTFGKGIVVDMDDRFITAKFSSGEVKLDKKIVLDKGILTFLQPTFDIDKKENSTHDDNSELNEESSGTSDNYPSIVFRRKDKNLYGVSIEGEKKATFDEELESLVKDKPEAALENQIDEFFAQIDEHKKREAKNAALREQFVMDYSIDSIMSLTKDQYVIGKGTKDTFCYRIEEELRELGDMHGANASKFGMYFGKSGNDKTEKYRMQKKFGEDPDHALKLIKEQIVDLIKAGEREDYSAIRDCKLWPLFRGKILSTYFPEKYLAIFIDEHLDYFISRLSLDVPDDADVLDKQECLVRWKESTPRLQDTSMYLFDRFLYSTFGRPFAEIKDAKDFQAQRDRDYPRKYASSVKIRLAEWKELLEDETVFFDSDIELLKKIYLEDNHATTLYDLSIKEGVPSSTYIPQVVGLAKRISSAMNLDPIKGDDGSRVWWRIPFWGRRREDGHFEWKIRPDLAKALVYEYPELDLIGLNEEEDEKLISDLKNSTMSEVENFEYTGGKKKKPAPVFTNGHKTYPRDRQIAINALAHAHHKCEVDEEHPTFIRKRSDKPYTEPHHLVPMSYSDSFDVSLDREENIVSLCSNCHNEIHYGRDAKVLVEKLYEDRKELLESVGISISLEELFDMYGIKQ